MTQEAIRAVLEANIGKRVKVAFDNHAETVLLISADPDGVLCRAFRPGQSDPETEFWVAYREISMVETTEAMNC
jgi:hypothetical protein